MKNYTDFYADRIQTIEEPAEAQRLTSICQYIDRTPGKRIFGHASPYQMVYGELQGLRRLSQLSTFDALCLAFDYGRAKGYRAARKEAGA